MFIQVRFPATLSLTIPFFGYNTSSPVDKDESDVKNVTFDLDQKLIESDQLFLANKYEDVVRLLEDYKVSDVIFCYNFLGNVR